MTLRASAPATLLLAGSAALFFSMGSAAAAVCAEHGAMVDYLASEYHESRQGAGLSARGVVIELYVSEAGTWTLLLSSPAGLACVVDAGDAWDGLTEAVLPGEGA
jgi:hypothetical protein